MAPPPWVNVEAIQRDNHPAVDLLSPPGAPLAESLDAAYPGGYTVSRVFAGHCLEHVQQHVLLSTVVEWFDLLEPGGQLGIIGPDWWKALRYYKDDLIDVQTLTQHGEVGDRWPVERWEQWYRDGMLDAYAMHAWCSTPERTVGVLRAAGFVVEEREPDHDGMAGWPITAAGGAQLACVATKPL